MYPVLYPICYKRPHILRAPPPSPAPPLSQSFKLYCGCSLESPSRHLSLVHTQRACLDLSRWPLGKHTYSNI